MSLALFMVLPWFLLAQASLWIAKVIGNKWDGPVGLQAHLLYLLCPDLSLAPCSAPHYITTSVSRVSPSSLPRQRPPFPSPPFTSQAASSVPFHSCHTTSWPPLSARIFALPRGQLPHFLQPLNPNTAEACWKNRQNGKSDNAMTQQILRGAFLHTLQYVRKTTTHAYLQYHLTAQWFLTRGVFKTTVASARIPLAAAFFRFAFAYFLLFIHGNYFWHLQDRMKGKLRQCVVIRSCVFYPAIMCLTICHRGTIRSCRRSRGMRQSK